MQSGFRRRNLGVPAALLATLLATLLGAASALAQTPSGATSLAGQVQALVAEPAVARAHWGVMVTAMDGSPIYARNEAQFFQPASNAKLFTTAAALALLGGDQPGGSRFVTTIVADGVFVSDSKLKGDLILVGDGDAGLSGRAFPYARQVTQQAIDRPSPLRALEVMADAVAASGLKEVDGNIVGDDTLFPFEPYAIDWVIDDAVWGYGAPVSALTINDNQIEIVVSPGASAGLPGVVSVYPDVPFYRLDIAGLQTTAAKSGTHLQIERRMGSKTLRIYGTIALDGKPDEEEVAIEDPAEYAALALKAMLEERGIHVSGTAKATHRFNLDAADFLPETKEPIEGVMHATQSTRLHTELRDIATCNGCEGSQPNSVVDRVRRTLAIHQSPAIREDVTLTNKVSQNLHAELLLHQLGAAIGKDGSTAQGARVIRAFLMQAAGIDRDDFVFYDGSGLSGHDLVTPRSIAKLLQFASTQPWFADYKSSLPIGGVDGGLTHRFTSPALKGHVFAKTGTLGEARALSGYLECASGHTVIFSILVGNHAPGTSADKDVMDRIVAAIAAMN